MKKRGVGVQFGWGCTGSEVGDTRSKHYFDITLWLWWPVRKSWYWKRGVNRWDEVVRASRDHR